MAYTPFVRTLKPGPPLEQGDDILVHQEVLQALGFLRWKDVRRGQYAENTWKAVEAFGKAHGLEPENTLGPRVHKLLAAHMTPGQGWRLAMCVAGAIKPAQIVQAALWYHGYGPYGYSQARPFPLFMPPMIARSLDCSGFSITCYHATGHISVLGGENQGGYGSTHTLVNYGQPVSLANVRGGDLVFQNTDEQNGHVVVAINSEQSVSHGRPGFPEIVAITRYPIYGIRRYL